MCEQIYDGTYCAVREKLKSNKTETNLNLVALISIFLLTVDGSNDCRFSAFHIIYR